MAVENQQCPLRSGADDETRSGGGGGGRRRQGIILKFYNADK